MKKTMGIVLLMVLFVSLNGFTFKDTSNSILSYLRRPVDLAVDTAVRAMNATKDIFVNTAKASIETASTLYSDVTVKS